MATAVVAVDLAAMQDAMRPARSFINTLAGLVNDQSYSGADAYAANQPMQYQIIGSNGQAIEGTTLYQNNPQPVTASNHLMIVLLALAAAFVVMHH